MKIKKVNLIGLIFTLIVIFFIYSCNKQSNDLVIKKISLEKNIQIVPEATALEIAKTFNPYIYYNLSNHSNHSPFKSKLNGYNQVESEYTITDHENFHVMYVFNYSDNNGFCLCLPIIKWNL
jgi:hypothetical protein